MNDLFDIIKNHLYARNDIKIIGTLSTSSKDVLPVVDTFKMDITCYFENPIEEYDIRTIDAFVTNLGEKINASNPNLEKPIFQRAKWLGSFVPPTLTYSQKTSVNVAIDIPNQEKREYISEYKQNVELRFKYSESNKIIRKPLEVLSEK